jgi:hypothetical protein
MQFNFNNQRFLTVPVLHNIACCQRKRAQLFHCVIGSGTWVYAVKIEYIKTVVIIKIHSHLTSVFKTDCCYFKIQKVRKFRAVTT